MAQFSFESVGTGPKALAFDYGSLLAAELEADVAQAYGLDTGEQRKVERDLREAVNARLVSNSGESVGESEDDDREFVLTNDARTQAEALVSYVVGCAFGRWDVRLAMDNTLVPHLAGMRIDDNGAIVGGEDVVEALPDYEKVKAISPPSKGKGRKRRAKKKA